MKINFTVCTYFILSLPIFFLFEFSTQTFAQSNFYEQLPAGLAKYSSTKFTDTLKVESIVEKNYWLPAAEVIGLNLSLGAVNTYIFNQDYAKISWRTIEDNLKTGFFWDEDHFLMNQFLHPYHGAAYFNSARSNGLNFWESTPYTIGGSLMWELFMENEPPAYNDFVTTSFSGVTLGEISFRVSNLIIDESSIGFERFLREFTSTVINPMQGFNRIIRGEMWRSGSPNKRPDFKLIVSTGLHTMFFSKNINDSKTYLTLRGNLNYGDRFDVDKHTKPFDYFSLHTEVNIAEGDDLVAIFASGVLTDGKLKLFEDTDNIIGIYNEFDFFINDVYKLTAASLTGQLINRVKLSNSIKMENNLSISVILMGGKNSQYAAEEGKEYNLGPGASGSIGMKFLFKNFGEVFSNYKRYWIHTLSGAEGEEFVGLLNIGINYQLLENSKLGLEFLLYERYGDYKYYPDTKDANSALRVYFRQII
ncbi:MAG: DUF3943 domain-containing protein [Ignavibacteriae bacterium]|nr:DUF3943 domain-containing protein [Ignavibacteriota bacterium]NOG97919.1 DUF3943 domain-containing protein [Ignavibacteriota bacterium]